MNKLQQVEAIMDATLEALRKLGLGGFGLHVGFHNHYGPDTGWQELAGEAVGRYEFDEMESTDGLFLESGPLDKGDRRISIFLPKGYLATLTQEQSVVAEHQAALEAVLDAGQEAML